ncbi:hypothetical protein [Synechococcus elongatus]|uniref:Uncharacterized protein n=1 Tax=Synechococcus elongatus (strain ATCC 33912 / PCC 7942 / FACHB-805) TaxID=1140 RepID=Q31MN4_SYNE7|nr:hypothetical protein [Synechococcus elongatus]ABB57685.1 hypothetical protein Synpcc7942_1655 [Synechococcus elongatus PCC 7942 = FACHB-805]AJD57823.1 hypothetical protein M744_08210 [Synechococcus elongatus UTEX 2973]MBD2586400.1 hypothetical protein [Synechococcus elongatus FACHB-242]MBD2687474.1 hypothetical protein [Synechococcus elongatus FACHB-1061]MBD2706817.1 hypothetical protein [Synechococcus elongatus PCC 7942 = FACHB-805]
MTQYQVDQTGLHEKFPTHLHQSTFWESLGRVVATFGYLEQVLGKAIFALTATKVYEEHEVQQIYDKWLHKLEHALKDSLANLINTYEQSVREHPDTTIENLDELLHDLREASKMRNVLCHGSWEPPDSNGAAIPFFVNHQMMIFDTPIDCKYLDQVQQHTVGLICAVINTVTGIGWQFPGLLSPGKPIE